MSNAPVRLRIDNFTPVERTPWGGTRLVSTYKREALAGKALPLRVGESWELSVEPDFPSGLEGEQRSLEQWLAEAPSARLGSEHERGRNATALLVKLLDAADNLSVQIHPADDYTGLGEGEGGKPESWYILEARPGAGLYLGFESGVGEAQVRTALREGGGALKALLRFIPCEPGDFFVIDAGTPHAIGAGLTLVEPQHVVPGKRGLTYRYWDWDRTYDSDGRLDPGGTPRTLHVEDALAVTRWGEVSGDGFVHSIRHRAGVPDVRDSVRIDPLCGPAGPLGSQWLNVSRLAGSGDLALPDARELRALTVVEGAITLLAEGYSVQAERGRTLAIPPAARGITAEMHGAHAVLASVV